MTFEHRCTVPVARETLWNFLMDVPQMASCVPGTSEVAAKEGGEAEAFTGRMRVTVGPIGLTLQGVMTIQERDQHAWRITAHAEAQDRRVGGGVFLNVSMTLGESGSNETELRIVSEARLMGKLGEFGQAVIRRKADTLVAEFAKNVAAHFAP